MYTSLSLSLSLSVSNSLSLALSLPACVRVCVCGQVVGARQANLAQEGCCGNPDCLHCHRYLTVSFVSHCISPFHLYLIVSLSLQLYSYL